MCVWGKKGKWAREYVRKKVDDNAVICIRRKKKKGNQETMRAIMREWKTCM